MHIAHIQDTFSELRKQVDDPETHEVLQELQGAVLCEDLQLFRTLERRLQDVNPGMALAVSNTIGGLVNAKVDG